jgi:hypothetical protein
MTDKIAGQSISCPDGLSDDAFGKNICKALQHGKMRSYHVAEMLMVLGSGATRFA